MREPWHYPQLSTIDEQGEDAYNSQNNLTSKIGFFQPMQLLSQFIGFGYGLIGVLIAGISHFGLLFGDRRGWSARRRLIIGIPGWILAAYLIWHAGAILLLP